ncbi:MAG TPA: hypothetical protein VL172_15890, partial [Kofleriaceae bacterium]|nr:hypothetical protein [Kofleriaceae bacterium]
MRLAAEEIGDDLPRALRACLAAVRTAPNDPAARRKLRGVAARHGAWEQVVPLLEDEVRAAASADVQAAFLEELADAHETFLDQPLEALNALERL